jgi:phosphoesterase RecJ-like protein
MMLDWTPLADLVETKDRFLLTTHVRPDGDALGSEIGMAGLLRQRGKDVRVVNSSATPPRYDFLDSESRLLEHYRAETHPASLADREVVIILDLSSWNQLGDMVGFIREFKGTRLVIDHHVSEDDLKAIVLKDTAAEATGTLVLSAIRALGGTLTPDIATGLWTAIAMDTGWFRHSSTRPSTLRDAADLIEAGAQADQIYRKLFERNTLGRLRLIGDTLGKMRIELGGRIAYTTVSFDDLTRTGAIPQDSEDLIDFTVSLRGVEIGLLFIEQARGGAKVSFRSRNGVDCARLAGEFGGGGHRAAAGATIPGPMSESVNRVLDAVRQELGQNVPPA